MYIFFCGNLAIVVVTATATFLIFVLYVLEIQEMKTNNKLWLLLLIMIIMWLRSVNPQPVCLYPTAPSVFKTKPKHRVTKSKEDILALYK